MVTPQRALVVALTALVFSGCGPSERERRINRSFGSAGGGGSAKIETIDMATAGTVSGTIKFSGSAPVRAPIKMTADRKCGEGQTGTPLREQVVVNDNGTLRDCLLYIETNKNYAPTTTPAEIDQKGCMYIPHVVGMQVNQPFNIKNSDNTVHNIHWIAAENGEENFGMAKPGMKVRSFEYPELAIKVKCDVHPWMNAWLHVFTHPFYAVTGEDGSFSIAGVPPGTHKLVLWHEQEEYRRTQTITVATGETATAEFTVGS